MIGGLSVAFFMPEERLPVVRLFAGRYPPADKRSLQSLRALGWSAAHVERLFGRACPVSWSADMARAAIFTAGSTARQAGVAYVNSAIGGGPACRAGLPVAIGNLVAAGTGAAFHGC